jgi:peptidoglycan/LPS O-acetylase OafA/YrhL
MSPRVTSTPAGIRPSTVYLPELESLRGVAIVLVMFFHADGVVRMPFLNTIGMWPPLATALIFGGHTGVTLFFVLSAFLLSMPFLAEAEGGRTVSRPDFYRRRALRILPLYWFMMLLGGLVTAAEPSDLRRAFAHMAFINSVPSWVRPFQPFTNVTWSLATEVQFYVLLPLLPLLLGTPQRRRVGAVVLAGYLAFYVCLVCGLLGGLGQAVVECFRSSVLGRGPIFLIGVLAAATYRRHGDRLRQFAARGGWAGDALLVGCLLGLSLLLRPIVFRGPFASDATVPLFAWHTLEAALWATVVLVVLVAPLRLRPVLVNPIFARLGVLSYSIYLIHQPVWTYSLQPVRSYWGMAAGWVPGTGYWLVGATALIIALSELTYRYVETPFLVRKSRLDA